MEFVAFKRNTCETGNSVEKRTPSANILCREFIQVSCYLWKQYQSCASVQKSSISSEIFIAVLKNNNANISRLFKTGIIKINIFGQTYCFKEILIHYSGGIFTIFLNYKGTYFPESLQIYVSFSLPMSHERKYLLKFQVADLHVRVSERLCRKKCWLQIMILVKAKANNLSISSLSRQLNESIHSSQFI